MRQGVIRKTAGDWPVAPHLADWAGICASFSWQQVRDELVGRAGEGSTSRTTRSTAMRSGPRAAAHRAALPRRRRRRARPHLRRAARQTNRFANALRAARRRHAATACSCCAGRMPELYVAVLGALKTGSVVSPLFSAFGPEPIATRMSIGGGRVLVTTDGAVPAQGRAAARAAAGAAARAAGRRRRRADRRARHARPRDADGAARPTRFADDRAPARTTWRCCTSPAAPPARPRARSTCTTRCVTHHATGRYALDLHADDIFWCTADPGWVTGTSYGIIAPLLHGVTSIVDEAEFDAERWYRILQEQQVSVWYTAPTAIRMLMKAGAELARRYDFPRCASSPASASRSTPRRCGGARRCSACRSTTTGGRPRPAAS